MTNYEKLMSEMTVEKLADLIVSRSCSVCIHAKYLDCYFCSEGLKKYLNKEVKLSEK